MTLIRSLCLAGFLLKAATSLAWGPDGHKIVANIAKSYLTKSALDSVQKYLGNATFEEASVWMDEMRSNPEYDYMKPWHYVNIERDKTYVNTSDWNVVNVLIKAIDQLRNRHKLGKGETGMYIKVLFHLVGDIHQPLHSGYGEDRGGNDIKVSCLGKPSNLHRVWDEDILLDKHITLQSCLALAPGFMKEHPKEAADTSVLNWMNEGRSFLPQVYEFKDRTIDQAYMDKNGPVVEKQLLLGGLHLAAVLNDVFK